ncbi:two pore domain potassium channel family protein [Zooshikella marina]|uniref:Two pore domain potassium channel family protein n=1 Tax=Zooshikella ganghwensis TaxID=202772 RepID=A0A4P9VM01_9GAMM|nr:ion channel [Zooshikella ganghwensis]MBU2704651.1 two pore domain potassium channel family protein [Zooshikella ganghwensis]RDH43130.1 two pore domain potassium channel family protein [Zooshikella ganghwensis]
MKVKVPRYSFASLLVALILVAIIFPLIPELITRSVMLKASLTLLLVCSIYVFSHDRRAFISSLILAIPTAITGWVSVSRGTPTFAMLDTFLYIVFFVYVIIRMIKLVFANTVITRDTLYGSMCIYLLFGIWWALCYSFIELLHPDSFHGINAVDGYDVWGFIYFSYVSLTTLGFGDVVPISRAAQSLTALEAVVGQFYLAVFVGRLVGMHISQKVA